MTQRPKRRERRRWTSTLAEPVPEGPGGQPAHAAGSEIAVIDVIDVPGIGPVSIPVPRPSAMLLDAAEAHLRRAERIRPTATRQVARARWIQPGFEMRFTNERLVYDFLEEAMAGVVLAHAALDNLLNELVPPDFTFTDDKNQVWSAERIQGYMGVERRLTQVAPIATGRSDLREEAADVVHRVLELKRLRDDVGHAKYARTYGGPDLLRTVFSDLFEADLIGFVAAVEAVGDHFGQLAPIHVAGRRGQPGDK